MTDTYDGGFFRHRDDDVLTILHDFNWGEFLVVFPYWDSLKDCFGMQYPMYFGLRYDDIINNPKQFYKWIIYNIILS